MECFYFALGGNEFASHPRMDGATLTVAFGLPEAIVDYIRCCSAKIWSCHNSIAGYALNVGFNSFHNGRAVHCGELISSIGNGHQFVQFVSLLSVLITYKD